MLEIFFQYASVWVPTLPCMVLYPEASLMHSTHFLPQAHSLQGLRDNKQAVLLWCGKCQIQYECYGSTLKGQRIHTMNPGRLPGRSDVRVRPDA